MQRNDKKLLNSEIEIPDQATVAPSVLTEDHTEAYQQSRRSNFYQEEYVLEMTYEQPKNRVSSHTRSTNASTASHSLHQGSTLTPDSYTGSDSISYEERNFFDGLKALVEDSLSMFDDSEREPLSQTWFTGNSILPSSDRWCRLFEGDRFTNAGRVGHSHLPSAVLWHSDQSLAYTSTHLYVPEMYVKDCIEMREFREAAVVNMKARKFHTQPMNLSMLFPTCRAVQKGSRFYLDYTTGHVDASEALVAVINREDEVELILPRELLAQFLAFVITTNQQGGYASCEVAHLRGGVWYAVKNVEILGPEDGPHAPILDVEKGKTRLNSAGRRYVEEYHNARQIGVGKLNRMIGRYFARGAIKTEVVQRIIPTNWKEANGNEMREKELPIPCCDSIMTVSEEGGITSEESKVTIHVKKPLFGWKFATAEPEKSRFPCPVLTRTDAGAPISGESHHNTVLSILGSHSVQCNQVDTLVRIEKGLCDSLMGTLTSQSEDDDVLALDFVDTGEKCSVGLKGKLTLYGSTSIYRAIAVCRIQNRWYDFLTLQPRTPLRANVKNVRFLRLEPVHDFAFISQLKSDDITSNLLVNMPGRLEDDSAELSTPSEPARGGLQGVFVPPSQRPQIESDLESFPDAGTWVLHAGNDSRKSGHSPYVKSPQSDIIFSPTPAISFLLATPNRDRPQSAEGDMLQHGMGRLSSAQKPSPLSHVHPIRIREEGQDAIPRAEICYIPSGVRDTKPPARTIVRPTSLGRKHPSTMGQEDDDDSLTAPPRQGRGALSFETRNLSRSGGIPCEPMLRKNYDSNAQQREDQVLGPSEGERRRFEPAPHERLSPVDSLLLHGSPSVAPEPPNQNAYSDLDCDGDDEEAEIDTSPLRTQNAGPPEPRNRNLDFPEPMVSFAPRRPSDRIVESSTHRLVPVDSMVLYRRGRKAESSPIEDETPIDISGATGAAIHMTGPQFPEADGPLVPYCESRVSMHDAKVALEDCSQPINRRVAPDDTGNIRPGVGPTEVTAGVENIVDPTIGLDLVRYQLDTAQPRLLQDSSPENSTKASHPLPAGVVTRRTVTTHHPDGTKSTEQTTCYSDGSRVENYVTGDTRGSGRSETEARQPQPRLNTPVPAPIALVHQPPSQFVINVTTSTTNHQDGTKSTKTTTSYADGSRVEEIVNPDGSKIIVKTMGQAVP